MLVAADLQRPNAVDQLSVVAERAGVPVFAPQPGNTGANPESTWGDPVEVAREGVEIARLTQHDVVIVDTAGRLAIDTALMEQLRQVRDAVQPDETLLVVDAMIGQDAVGHRAGLPRGRRLRRRRPDQARRRRPRRRGAVGRHGHRRADHVRLHGREAHRLRAVPPRPDGLADPRHGRRADPDRAGGEGVRRQRGREDGRQGAGRRGLHPRRLPVPDAGPAQDGQPRQAARDAARHGRDPRPDRQPRREGDRPRPGDHPVDDPGRAGRRQDPQRLAAGAHRPRLGRAGQRGQRPGRAVRRGAEDDAPDALGHGDAGDARDAGRGRLEEGQGPRRSSSRRKKKSRSGNPAKRAHRGVGPGCGPAGLPGGLEGFDPAVFDPSMLDPEALKKMGDLPPAFKDLLGGR